MPESPERTALYRLYDAEDRLLYIGITNSPDSRWKSHAHKSPWWPQVAAKHVEWLPTRQQAKREERAGVEEHNPPYNRIWNTWEIRAHLQAEDRRRARAELDARRSSITPKWFETGLHDPD